MRHTIHLQCPACNTDFAGKAQCPGCGADLSRLMEIAAESFYLRQQARQALRSGRYGEACKLSTRAQDLQTTPIGQRLLQTARLMHALRIGSRA